MLIGLYFSIVIALPLALGSYVLYNGLPRSRQCPTCAAETIRLQSRGHALCGLLLRRELHLRWCARCGWHGTARPQPTGTEPVPMPTASPPAPSIRKSTTGGDRVDLRSLDVDGHSWRVMVECWAEDGRWLARLVFVAPGGQVCADKRSLEGESVLEVISQAFRLPEQALAGRLRRAIR